MDRRDLRSVRHWRHRIDHIREQMTELNEALVSIGSPDVGGDHVQTTRPASRMEEQVVRAHMTKTKLMQQARYYMNRIRDVAEAIDTVPDIRYRVILRARYLAGMTQEDTAQAMRLSQQHVSRLDRAATAAFEEETKKVEKKLKKFT